MIFRKFCRRCINIDILLIVHQQVQELEANVTMKVAIQEAKKETQISKAMQADKSVFTEVRDTTNMIAEFKD